MVVSPNVDFDESSVSFPLAKFMETLRGLTDAFGAEEHIEDATHIEGSANEVSSDTTKWESDEEVLQPKATEDEEVPNGA